ncbi:MAG TPA: aspartate-semialdehyde dehydrogenase [Pyrinomonadaceae bacterium]|jgi:aspartate-semialdehyde dehydrogenase
MQTSRKYRVGILGATGTVGQRFIQLLAHHPQFEVTALAASDRSQGKTYARACSWKLAGEMPESARELLVQPPQPPMDCELIFSSLPGEIARRAEEEFARAGYPVISNSSAFRMDRDVPLLIPEVNHEHLSLLEAQRGRLDQKSGFIVTNPNCSAIGVVLPLAPLHARFGLEAVMVTTMQAISGAGYPGVASLDITDNLVPFISGEEEKLESETLKILGEASEREVRAARFRISAQCHRVNVTDGHTAAVRFKLSRRASLAEVREALVSFTSLPQKLKLHSAPLSPIIVRDEEDRPQPRLDRDAGGSMSVTVGRLAPDNVFDYRFVSLSHNTIRGAAGAAILNAELLIAKNYLTR